jgi:hypothetical protein
VRQRGPCRSWAVSVPQPRREELGSPTAGTAGRVPRPYVPAQPPDRAREGSAVPLAPVWVHRTEHDRRPRDLRRQRRRQRPRQPGRRLRPLQPTPGWYGGPRDGKAAGRRAKEGPSERFTTERRVGLRRRFPDRLRQPRSGRSSVRGRRGQPRGQRGHGSRRAGADGLNRPGRRPLPRGLRARSLVGGFIHRTMDEGACVLSRGSSDDRGRAGTSRSSGTNRRDPPRLAPGRGAPPAWRSCLSCPTRGRSE